MLRFLIIISAFELASCKRKEADINYVRSSLWQWSKGYRAGEGDFIGFDASGFYTVSHDTIFRKGVPGCIIIETNKAAHLMKVRSLNGQFGYYDNSEQFTR